MSARTRVAVVLLLASCHAATVDPTGDAGGATPRAPSTAGPGPGISLPADAMSASPPSAEQTCAALSLRAERAKVDLLFLVDVSSSMAKVVPGGALSKLQMARDALVGFMRDPGSSELYAAVQFFPVRAKCFTGICVGPANPPGPTPPCPCPAGLTCMPTPGTAPMLCPGSPASCELGDYRSPQVAFAPVAGLAGTTMASFAAQDPLAGASGTPTGPALLGAFEELRARAASTPGHRGAVVVISDGVPTLCEPLTPDALAAPITQARQGVPGIPTFFVGVYAAADRAAGAGAVVERLAQAGGTTAFTLDVAMDLTKRLQEAFAQIRTLTVPCDLAIPPARPGGGAIDFTRVNLRVSRNGAAADVPYVQSAARCQPGRGGWHYDVDPTTGTPTRIVMCADTCKSLQDDATATADLRFGCKTIGID